MLVTRIIFLGFQNDIMSSSNYCHSEKTENLASSVDFRLIQNLSMLIKAEVSLLGWKAQPTVTTIE